MLLQSAPSSRKPFPNTSGKGPYLSAFTNQPLDSNLTSSQLENFPYELQAMSQAAYMCLQEGSHLRPPISKVLELLEEAVPFLTQIHFAVEVVICKDQILQTI